MLVAHGLQMTGQHPGDTLGLGLRAEAADALHLLGQHHVIVRDVRHDEGAHRPLAALADGAGRAGRQGGQQVQHPVHLLDHHLARAHRLDREEPQGLQPPVAVGDEVDGGGERGHRKGGIGKRVLHDQTPSRMRMPRVSSAAVAAACSVGVMPAGQTTA